MSEDRLYLNGTFLTMDASQPRAEAMLVKGSRIAGVGSRDEMETLASTGAERIDLAGQTVIPGFNDSHAHILWFGLTMDQLDVGVGAAENMRELLRAVGLRATATPPEGWIVGRGYDQNMLAEQRHPTRADLDSASSNNPVLLRHTSGHVLAANSRALQLAGVTHDTPDPQGGEIERDVHGHPTGVLKETAMDLVTVCIPPPTTDEGVAAIVAAMDEMARHGITSASDAATGQVPPTENLFEMYERAAESGKLAGRIQLMPLIAAIAPPDTDIARSPGEFSLRVDRDLLHIGPAKIFSDGALSTKTAAMRQPYADDQHNHGILIWSQDELDDMVRRAHAAGWQIATHALGDAAVEAVVDAYERALTANPRDDHRHRIEHCMVADDALASRIARLGIVLSLQPDIFRLGDGYVGALGFERACDTIPIGRFRELGARMAFNSDCPVIPCDPLAIIRSSIERRTPTGIQLGVTHAATVAEALRNYTAGGAFITRTEAAKGRLKSGMLADFTVLNRNPLEVSIDEWDALSVTMTVSGGRQTYAA